MKLQYSFTLVRHEAPSRESYLVPRIGLGVAAVVCCWLRYFLFISWWFYLRTRAHVATLTLPLLFASYSTKTLFQLPPTTILYMPCDVMMSIATTLRYYASQIIRY